MLQYPDTIECFPFFSVAHLLALENEFCISRSKNSCFSSLINYLINKYVICQGVPTARWTQHAQLVLRHFIAYACVGLTLQSLIWTDAEPNSILLDNKLRTKANRIRHTSVCTLTSTFALYRHTENELTDLVKIAQLAEWMTHSKESEKEQCSREGTIRDSAESRDNIHTYHETKLKFLVLLFLLFPIENLTVQVERSAVKAALIPCIWHSLYPSSKNNASFWCYYKPH